MSEAFIGEVRCFGFDFAPRGWAFCNGQLLPIAQNTALFSLLGTIYGGNGQSTFALPNLQGRVAIGMGQGPGLSPVLQGEASGAEAVTLTLNQMASHGHFVFGTSSPATDKRPSNGAAFAQSTSAAAVSPAEKYYALDTSPATTALNPATVSIAGGSQAHNNMQPYQVLNWCIALQGIFPPRS